MFAVKTGLIYSQRLIEKAIRADGKCPVSDADLSLDDLVPVTSKLLLCCSTPLSSPGMSPLALFLSTLLPPHSCDRLSLAVLFLLLL